MLYSIRHALRNRAVLHGESPYRIVTRPRVCRSRAARSSASRSWQSMFQLLEIHSLADRFVSYVPAGRVSGVFAREARNSLIVATSLGLIWLQSLWMQSLSTSVKRQVNGGSAGQATLVCQLVKSLGRLSKERIVSEFTPVILRVK